MRWLSFVGLSAGLWLASCASPRPASQVLVFVDAQPLVRGTAAHVVIEVSGGHPGETFTMSGPPLEHRPPLAWPFDVTIVPAGGDVSRIFEIQATAYDSGEHLVSQTRLRAGFVRGESRRTTLVLEDACFGVSCDEGLVCSSGRCVPLMMMSGDDAGMPDAGVDGGGTERCANDVDCDDGNLCNGLERCTAGTCGAGTRLDCDDHVECTRDTCDGNACVHDLDDTRCTLDTGGHCDPVNDCQYAVCGPTNCVSAGCQTARCRGAVCVREFACATGQSCCGTSCVPTGCDDADQCTTDFCGMSGTCEHVVRTGPCDDHDVCTSGEQCDPAGACRASNPPMACDDGNPCTDDRCDPVRACVSAPNAAGCSDGNPCTRDDLCGGGVCVSGPPPSCDDGIACTADSCDATGACAHRADDVICGAGFRCDPALGCQPTSACTMTNCQPTPGACEMAACSGATCMRSTTCTTGTTCCGGACVPTGCDDGNPCTDDLCNGVSCVHTNHTRGCSDGDPCTIGDQCSGGACQGIAMPCVDPNPCTDDVCVAGVCEHQPVSGVPCDDGNACTMDDLCQGGTCWGNFGCSGGLHCCGGSCEPPGSC